MANSHRHVADRPLSVGPDLSARDRLSLSGLDRLDGVQSLLLGVAGSGLPRVAEARCTCRNDAAADALDGTRGASSCRLLVLYRTNRDHGGSPAHCDDAGPGLSRCCARRANLAHLSSTITL